MLNAYYSKDFHTISIRLLFQAQDFTNFLRHKKNLTSIREVYLHRLESEDTCDIAYMLMRSHCFIPTLGLSIRNLTIHTQNKMIERF